MKTINLSLLLIAIWIVPIISFAQEDNVCGMSFVEAEETYSKSISSTCNPTTSVCRGKYKPAQDTLRVLMVYVRFEDDPQMMMHKTYLRQKGLLGFVFLLR